MSEDLQIVTAATLAQALAWSSGFLPPRRSQYPSDAEFLEDAMAFNDALHAGMVAHGVDPLSTLLAGMMPETFEAGEAEMTQIYTMQQGGLSDG